jgi:hypothetical protein
MNHHRTISTAAVLLALTVALPAGALADPLLSGYGGPGQGSQAILGSTLLGGPTSGGGGSEAEGGAGLTAAEPPVGAAVPGAPVRAGALAPTRSGANGGGRGGRASGAVRRPSAGVSEIYPASERGAVTSSGTLGLSGRDLAYILLTLCALVVTAVITRRLTPKTAARRHG